MARVYEGRKARVYGAAGGLLMFGTGAGMYVFMGATAANVPLPAVLEGAIHDAVPALAPAAGQRMPLVMVALFGLVSLVLVAIGLRNTIEALVEDDYTLKVTGDRGL
jgi:hypothetical protein